MIEAWARAYIESTDLAHKLAPPPLPEDFAAHFSPLRLQTPGRPPELRPAKKGERLPKPEALKEPRHRARVLHAFLHHELQAAELMCWAVLAFPHSEPEFRRGLLRICHDEIRHMNAYLQQITRYGFSLTDFGVRDWFWSRVPACADPISFVAVMGMGLEAANLEHAPLFAERFRAAGDEEGASVQERIAEDELAHVRFGTQWFKHWTNGCDFDTWVNALPRPWSPWVLRGDPLAENARLASGMSPAFVQALKNYVPDKLGRP